MEEAIKTLQKKIEARHQANILHVLNGFHMLKRFKDNNLIKENQTYVPFNEAMCWGEADTKIFSDSFIEKRVKSLKTTEVEYRRIVLESLKPLFKEKFDSIVLWFGDDMFCQINLITILAYLEQSGYKGDVLFCMVLERIDDILPDAFKIDVEGYSDDLLCRFPEYGLGDLQYQTMIEDNRK